MSTIIRVRCTDQVLTFENTPVIASGGQGEDFVSFAFCGKWDGMAKTAVFWRDEADAYHAVLDSDDVCAIPTEVLTQEGVIRFGVFGVDSEGNQRTSDVLSYTIVKGVITDGTKPSAPTQDIYMQLLANYAEVCVKLERSEGVAVDAADAAKAAQQAAEAAAASAGAIEDVANSAKDTADAAANTAASAVNTANTAKDTANAAKNTANSHAARHGTGGADPLTPASIGAAAAGHDHAAGDITSGTFPVARGGTGKASWTAYGLIYPSAGTTLTQLALPTVAGSVLCQDKSGAPYWKPLAPTWYNLPLASGVTGETDDPPKYCKDLFGFVHLMGFINSLVAAGDVVATLPAGYRPVMPRHLPFTYKGDRSTPCTGKMSIQPDGSVTINSIDNESSYSDSNSPYLCLDCCFYVG